MRLEPSSEIIKWSISENCSVYDFAGTATSFPPKETDKGYGVYLFKKSFGAEIVDWCGYFDYVLRPTSYQLFRAAERALPYGVRVLFDWPERARQWFQSAMSQPTPN